LISVAFANVDGTLEEAYRQCNGHILAHSDYVSSWGLISISFKILLFSCSLGNLSREIFQKGAGFYQGFR
jgi:hypothetical protein